MDRESMLSVAINGCLPNSNVYPVVLDFEGRNCTRAELVFKLNGGDSFSRDLQDSLVAFFGLVLKFDDQSLPAQQREFYKNLLNHLNSEDI